MNFVNTAHEILDMDLVGHIIKKVDDRSSTCGQPVYDVYDRSGVFSHRRAFSAVAARDKEFELLSTALRCKKERASMITSLKDYLKQHKDLFITMAILFLLDHFVFRGVLRNRLHALVERILGNVEKKAEKLAANDE